MISEFINPAVHRSMIAELRKDVLVQQGFLLNVISEILSETKAMELRKVPAELIAKKRSQADTLATLNNTVDDLVQMQQHQILQLRIENLEMWKLFERAVQRTDAREEIMKYLNENKHTRK